MALQSLVNNLSGADGGAEVMYGLKLLLVGCGWDVVCSGGGTGSGHFSPAGDCITDVAHMNVSRAWYRIRAPAAMSPRREFIVQRGSGGDPNWWIRVSAEDGFTGGAPDEDDAPTATDEQNLWGTTTAGTVLFAAAGTYRFHLLAQDAAPYAFAAFTLISATGAGDGVFCFWPLESGTYPATDQDPAVYYAYRGASEFDIAGMNVVASSPQGWYKKDLAGEAWCRFLALRYNESAGGTNIPEGIGTNPYTGNDETFPIPIGRTSSLATQIGWKGFGSTFIRYTGTHRSNGDTLSTGGTIDHIIVGSCAIMWPNTVPVL